MHVRSIVVIAGFIENGERMRGISIGKVDRSVPAAFRRNGGLSIGTPWDR